VCQHSTEFHFPSTDDQLEKIRDEVKEAVAWRQSHWGCNGSGEHLVTLTSSEQQVWVLKMLGTELITKKPVFIFAPKGRHLEKR
jgi:hypothetical protein